MNLVDEAEALMLYQFSKSTRLKALIRGLVKPFHDADDELQRLHNGHYIDQAHGATLDIIGSIVDQPRYDMSDEDYRPWIKVAIYLNNGNGTPENIFTVLSILFSKKPPIRMEEYLPNDVIFTFFEYPKFPTTTLFAIVRSAMPIGTKCQFIRADPTAHNDSGVSMLSATIPLPAFRLDFTEFDRAYFADFFEGENNHE